MRDQDEDPWQQTSGAPPTKGDDFVIEEPELDTFLAEHGLRRSMEPAQAGDVLFFSSMALVRTQVNPHHNLISSL